MDKKITLKNGKEIRVFSQEDLVAALQKKYPDGMTLHVNHVNTDMLYEYIYKGTMEGKDYVDVALDPAESRGQLLDCRMHISPSLYGQLNFIGEDKYRFQINEELVKAGLEDHIEETAYMNSFPGLDGGHATIDISLLGYMTIQGKYLYESIALLLQREDGADCLPTAVLAKYLTNGTYRQKLKDRGDKTFDIPPIKKTDEIVMVRNENYMYLCQKGVLGYARVRPSRDYGFYGKLPDEEIQKHIKKMVSERNETVHLKDNSCKPFFVNPAENAVRLQCFNPARNIVVPVTVQKDFEGKDMYVIDNAVLTEAVFRKNYIDVTGRITDIRVKDGNSLSCSIDGEQKEERSFDRTKGMGRVFAGLENKLDNVPDLKERLYYSLAANVYRDKLLAGKVEQEVGEAKTVDRITEIRYMKRNDGAHFIRCKVDGVQQGFERLNAKDARIMDYFANFPENGIAYKEQLFLLAQKYFKFALHESQQQKMTRSM